MIGSEHMITLCSWQRVPKTGEDATAEALKAQFLRLLPHAKRCPFKRRGGGDGMGCDHRRAGREGPLSDECRPPPNEWSRGGGRQRYKESEWQEAK